MRPAAGTVEAQWFAALCDDMEVVWKMGTADSWGTPFVQIVGEPPDWYVKLPPVYISYFMNISVTEIRKLPLRKLTEKLYKTAVEIYTTEESITTKLLPRYIHSETYVINTTEKTHLLRVLPLIRGLDKVYIIPAAEMELMWYHMATSESTVQTMWIPVDAAHDEYLVVLIKLLPYEESDALNNMRVAKEEKVLGFIRGRRVPATLVKPNVITETLLLGRDIYW